VKETENAEIVLRRCDTSFYTYKETMSETRHGQTVPRVKRQLGNYFKPVHIIGQTREGKVKRGAATGEKMAGESSIQKAWTPSR